MSDVKQNTRVLSKNIMRPKGARVRENTAALVYDSLDAANAVAKSPWTWFFLVMLAAFLRTYSAWPMGGAACQPGRSFHAGNMTHIMHPNTLACGLGYYSTIDIEDIDESCALDIKRDGVVIVPPRVDCPHRLVQICFMCSGLFGHYCTLLIEPNPDSGSRVFEFSHLKGARHGGHLFFELLTGTFVIAIILMLCMCGAFVSLLVCLSLLFGIRTE